MTQKPLSLASLFCVCLLLALCLSGAAFAQNHQIISPPVVAAASSEQARFLAANEVASIRLEVFTLGETRLYDSDFKAGNLLDWHWQDQQGQRLPDGTYRCLLTMRDLTGQASQRQGILLVQNGTMNWQSPEQAGNALRNTAASAAGRIAYFATVTNPSELAAAVLAHDGKDAQLLTGSGGLSVRSGNFLKGDDEEWMKLHADGKLEVKGLIQTNEGIVFPDGSVQKTAYVASGQALKQLAEDGKPVRASPNAPAVGGSGTPNRLMKWAANGVDATDSTITDLGPGGGINVNGSVLSSFNNVSATSDFVGGFMAFWPTGTSRALLLRSSSLSGNLWIGHLGNVGLGFSDPASRFATGGNATVGSGYYNTAAPINGLLVEGKVGIGIATTPFAKMDVYNTGSPYAILGVSNNAGAIAGVTSGGQFGVLGQATGGYGVWGFSSGGDGSQGVRGEVTGTLHSNYGVYGTTPSAYGGGAGGPAAAGVYGSATATHGGVFGVYGTTPSVDVGAAGVKGIATATTSGPSGVAGVSDASSGDGVQGTATAGTANSTGVLGIGTSPGFAGRFFGKVHISGSLSKGSGSFKIDHPLDPENKYLYHSFVESPDMMNIYNGNITTDARGDALVAMPDWFEPLNRDFRYQLTVIGQFAQAIVAEEMSGNQFKIKTSLPNVKVSWQVTGIRQDAFARKHPITVEEDKPATERGSYLHPDAFGKDEEMGVMWRLRPGAMKEAKARREAARQRQANPSATEDKAVPEAPVKLRP